MVAAVLDGMDGRIARMLNGTSRFGAELDSLSDNVAFGVSPAITIRDAGSCGSRKISSEPPLRHGLCETTTPCSGSSSSAAPG